MLGCLTNEQCHAALVFMRDFGGDPLADMAQFWNEDQYGVSLDDFVRWGELLGLMQPAGAPDQWTLDPFIGTLAVHSDQQRAMNPWSLPGPRRLIDRTVDRLVNEGGFCAVLLRPTLCLDDVESALSSRLNAGGWRLRTLMPGDQPLPRAMLQDVGQQLRHEVTARDVLHAPELAGVVFVHHASDMTDMDVWRRFLGQIEIQARTASPLDPPRFIVLAPPAHEVGWEESTGYFVTDLGIAMSPVDTQLLAFDLAAERNLKDHEAQLLCQVCASIALWDIELLARPGEGIVGRCDESVRNVAGLRSRT